MRLLFFKQMCLIQYTYNFLSMYAVYDLDFFLQLTFSISTIVLRLESQLVKQTFVKPSWREF